MRFILDGKILLVQYRLAYRVFQDTKTHVKDKMEILRDIKSIHLERT